MIAPIVAGGIQKFRNSAKALWPLPHPLFHSRQPEPAKIKKDFPQFENPKTVFGYFHLVRCKSMSAFWGKAEMRQGHGNFAF